jgi:CDP-glucose 4,6-dehydratase
MDVLDQISTLPNFYRDKKVFVTGHTGFKGSWLCMVLHHLGAKVYGYSLPAPTTPSLFEIGGVREKIQHREADIRDLSSLEEALQSFCPDIILHLAAQPLVRDSYKIPVDTYAINVMGTVNLLEAARKVPSIRAIVNITTDKVYENKEWIWGYRENEPFGGYDPYSSSKACSELVTAAFRSSYFNPQHYSEHKVGLASARAGNVIGGGDWANDRLIPDFIKAIVNKQVIEIRNPNAIRPWQHVLEPLAGYLILAKHLCEKGDLYAEGWNFGPNDEDAIPVELLTSKIAKLWGNNASYQVTGGQHLHEAGFLKLDCSKSKARLGWTPKWNIDMALKKTIGWYQDYQNGKDMKEVCLQQIKEYFQ